MDRNNLEFFGPFLDLQEFFKNQGLSFETSDFDFRDLLDELFHIDQKLFFEKKNQNDRSSFIFLYEKIISILWFSKYNISKIFFSIYLNFYNC